MRLQPDQLFHLQYLTTVLEEYGAEYLPYVIQELKSTVDRVVEDDNNVITRAIREGTTDTTKIRLMGGEDVPLQAWLDSGWTITTLSTGILKGELMPTP